MPLSTLTAPNQIPENSAATPGLWNSPISTLWQDIYQVASDVSTIVGTGNFLSTNSLYAESGNTIRSFSTHSMLGLFPTTLSASSVGGFGDIADARAGGLLTNVYVAGHINAGSIRVGAAAFLTMRRVNTSFTSPSAVLTNESIGNIQWVSVASGAIVQGAVIQALATEAWGSGATGTKLIFNITGTGTTGVVPALTLDQDKTGIFAGAITVASTINSQTISSAANFTGTLTVASDITQTAGTAALQAVTATTINASSTATVQKLTVTGGSSATATIFKHAVDGVSLRGATGSSYDISLVSASDAYIMANPTGTINARFFGDIGGNATWAITQAGAASGFTTITTSSTINSQTISSAANFTGTVTIATSVLCAVLDSNAATDLLLKRNNVTQLTLGGTGALFVAGLALSGATVPSHGIQFGTSAPGTLADGQVWYDGTDLKTRLAGATKTIVVV